LGSPNHSETFFFGQKEEKDACFATKTFGRKKGKTPPGAPDSSIVINKGKGNGTPEKGEGKKKGGQTRKGRKDEGAAALRTQRRVHPSVLREGREKRFFNRGKKDGSFLSRKQEKAKTGFQD